ncbi:ABC-1 domain protein [Beutenbergia cavernae DSM 12333]|uniref:ABC-1 domain protein n=1 Tax=Beutenbergia cavernae (strain ATCC BAA-8 / DSM 12333 / CCUG 43141 / JCM 11478 / NBRC 16432 / NCIMB 13614 / HKI 0122) TaxID=471853 RepID=C5C411_BEUC1|nr:AarF/UbiB family protein [Beutenbergia cavernae]ACQ79924.1 ABC-1 domain protein [Beutenbergia cavernae DSM 12333]
MTFVVSVLGVLIAVVLAVVAALMVRRLLGVPVGWPRSVLVGLAMISLGAWFVSEVMLRSGMSLTSAEENPLGAMLVGGLAFAWVFVLGVLALVILEVFVPTGSLPHPLAAFRGWRSRRRRTRRYLQVSAIAARHGLGAVAGAPFRGAADETHGKALRDTLAASGVTFVKVGQLMSTRPDVVPEDIVRELSTLQTQAPALPWEQLEPALATALGSDPSDVLAHVDAEPLAAASVAQVHAGTLRTGEEVVLKIQRPEARAQVTADLDILDRFAARLDRSAAWARSIGVRDLADGFAASLREELDYRVEAENMRVVAGGAGQGSGRVVVPRVFGEHSGERLLVMERLHGVPLGSASRELARLDDETRRRLATDLVREVMRQVLVVGVFHADLHPGNVILLDDGRLGLLDFGSVGRLDPASRDSIALLFAAFARQDGVGATDALIDLLERPEHLDDRQVEREVGQVVMFATSGAATAGSSGVFAQLLRVVQRAQLGVPPQVAAAFRAFAALEGTLALIDPELPLVATATSVGRDLMGARFDPASLRTTLETQLAAYLPLVQRLPRRIDRLTDDLTTGRFTANVRVLADPRDRRYVTSLVQHVVVAVLAGAATLGAIVLLVADTGPFLVAGVRLYTYLGYGLLLGGFVLALRALAGVVRREA